MQQWPLPDDQGQKAQYPCCSMRHENPVLSPESCHMQQWPLLYGQGEKAQYPCCTMRHENFEK